MSAYVTEAQLEAIGTVIGTRVKAKIDALPGGSGGGLSGTAIVTLPRTPTVQWQEIVAAPGVVAGSNIFAQFAAGEDGDENEAWALSALHPPIGRALTNEIEFTVQFASPEAGPIKINWKV